MTYELVAAFRTIKNEGFGPLFGKLRLYFKDLFCFVPFLLKKRPAPMTPESSVDFARSSPGGLISPAQVRSEFLQLATLVHRENPRVVVEIGTAGGGTLFTFCSMAHPDAEIISIDLPLGIHGGGYPYWKSFLYRTFTHGNQKLHLLRGNSHDREMLEMLKSILNGRPIDFLFIDGDHTYAGVKQDFEMYSSLVRKGAPIALHDVCLHPPEMDCHVDEFWNELKKSRPSTEFIENHKQGWGGIGVVTA